MRVSDRRNRGSSHDNQNSLHLGTTLCWRFTLSSERGLGLGSGSGLGFGSAGVSHCS